MTPIPVTIITGFLGSGKTTLILNLIPQLPKNYRLALLKNEFGDLAVDSQLASQQSISGVRELLNGCICCNLVGQLGDALLQLRNEVKPDRIIIETSGSAFPATLAMEVNRLAHSNSGSFVLDGVISVIDVENWKGYDDTSYTAKMQAKYTDLIVFNKWELADERRFDECLDRVGDLEVQTAWVKSDKGRVDHDVIMGIDGALISKEGVHAATDFDSSSDHNGHSHNHGNTHQSEVEVLSLLLPSDSPTSTVDLDALEGLLLAAPKDEVYRIKGYLRASKVPADSTGGQTATETIAGSAYYVLNWAFGRWSFTKLANVEDSNQLQDSVIRLTFILARGEAMKWKKKIEGGGFLQIEGESSASELKIEKLG
ncbi:hypothetical protein UCRPC4_g05961 [Phaeomoniella chlamydospora]|uniref:CobW/HypB/UreG nucleotide-binding domain-containing protein n=1 Tax=Phaeomoniella chlamydospora TaxID=158046 RepID=A0A0G2E0I4_PHACM|nr:hypothetical protein UCRPC4_g05961 [Phaeomoniella chlamydospora]